MMEIKLTDTVWHTFQVEDTLRKLGTNAQKGLSDSQVAQRLQQYGPNELVEAPRPGFWQRLFAQFNNFVIYLLLFAAVASFALGDQIEALAIVAIVILNATLGVVQEGRAEGALSALKKLAPPPSQSRARW